MANDVTCPWCGAGDSPRRFKCWECGTPYGVKFALPESYEDSRTRECFRNQLAAVTADASRYITADDAIGEICLQAGFDCESTLEAVQAMAEKLATVTAERDELRRRIDEAPVYRMFPRLKEDPPSLHSDEKWRGGVRVRLVRDDQPEDTAT